MSDEDEPIYYPIPLVGEQYYQPAVIKCRAGDIVDICIEQGNPHDELAVVARRRSGGETIGYIARDSFVQGVVHDQGRSIVAAVLANRPNPRGFMEIVLQGAVYDEPAPTVRYRPGEASQPQEPARQQLAEEPASSGSLPIIPMVGIILVLLLLVRCMT